jgi:threonine dehydratase
MPRPTVPAGLASQPIDAIGLVRGVREPTPLVLAPELDSEREILLKREDLGPNGSFKWRGALCACADFQIHGSTIVVTASTGNHGAATAWAAARLGLEAHVIVPVRASETKCEIIESHGAELHREGKTLEESAEFGRQLATNLGGTWFEDGASEAQLLGAGTIGAELIEAGAAPEVVIAPLACGALAGGLAASLAARDSDPWIVAVHSTAFPRMGALLRGERDPGEIAGVTFADGLADTRIVEPAFSSCQRHVDQVAMVSDEDLRLSIRELHARCGILVEGAAAAPLAALRASSGDIKPGRTVLILTGRNLDPTIASEILD